MLRIIQVVSPVQETHEDQHVLKAIFMAGAGGSGKSKIAKGMFGGTGLRYLDQDRHLERFLKEAGIPLSKAGSSYGLFKKAQRLKNKQLAHYSNLRAGIVIDVTGWDAKRVLGPRTELERLGYDTSMVFVRTSLETALARNKARERRVPEDYIVTAWKGSLRNLTKFRTAFGDENFVLVDNDATVDVKDWASTVEPALHRAGMQLLQRPLKNVNGKRWLAKRRGEQVPLSPGPKTIDVGKLAAESVWTPRLHEEFTSRYGDGPMPDPSTICPGQCEGMGRVPVKSDDPDEEFRQLWAEAEKESPADDGWHFVVCPVCHGTGRKSTPRESVRVVLPGYLAG